MGKDWVKIYESIGEPKVDLMMQYLKDKGIESVVINKRDSMYLFGEIELYVSRDQVIMARALIDSLLI